MMRINFCFWMMGILQNMFIGKVVYVQPTTFKKKTLICYHYILLINIFQQISWNSVVQQSFQVINLFKLLLLIVKNLHYFSDLVVMDFTNQVFIIKNTMGRFITLVLMLSTIALIMLKLKIQILMFIVLHLTYRVINTHKFISAFNLVILFQG